MPGPNTYDGVIREVMDSTQSSSPKMMPEPDDGKGFKNYIEPLAEMLMSPQANYRPGGAADTVLSQLLDTNSYTDPRRKRDAKPIPRNPVRQMPAPGATDIPGQEDYTNPAIPLAGSGADVKRRILEQMLGNMNGGRT